MWNPFKIFRKAQKIETKQEKKDKIRETTLKILEKIARKKNKEEQLTEISITIRQFFKTYYGIRYAFTTEELSDELNKRRIDPYLKRKAKRILDRLNETQYYSDHTPEQVKTLIQETKELIQLL